MGTAAVVVRWWLFFGEGIESKGGDNEKEESDEQKEEGCAGNEISSTIVDGSGADADPPSIVFHTPFSFSSSTTSSGRRSILLRRIVVPVVFILIVGGSTPVCLGG